MSRPSISRTNLTGSGTGTGSGSGTPASSSPKPGWATASPRKQATTPSSSSSIPTTDLTPFLGLKLQLTLADGSTTTGHLFAHDVSSSLVILETPPSSQVPYPPTAASAPTTKRSQAVNAAQGGSSQQPPTGFKLIKERLIKDVKVLDDDGGDGDANTTPFKLSTVTPVNVAIAEKREMAASRDAALRASRIGVGVTENGQDVFEALSKTLPCRWHEKHIIVMDEVILSEPYDLSSLRVPKYTPELLEKLTSDDGSTTDEKLTAQLPTGETLTTAKGKARSWQRVGRVLEGERRKIAARRAAAGQGV